MTAKVQPVGSRLVGRVGALTVCAAYSPQQQLPVKQQARPFQALNANMRGSASPVAARVTGDRLVHARSEPRNWMTYYGAYDGERYRPPNQINTRNVAKLTPAWVFQYGLIGPVPSPAIYAFEATPIVVDAVMYLTGADAYVWAIDARSGQTLWE